MLRTNPRALLRTMMSLGNPQLDEPAIRERVDAQLAYSPETVTAERGEGFLSYDANRMRVSEDPRAPYAPESCAHYPHSDVGEPAFHVE